MDADSWQAVSAIGAAIAAVASVIAVILAGVQIRSSIRQLEQSEKATRDQLSASLGAAQSQNALTLTDYLERPDNLAARRAIGPLGRKPYAQWTTDDKWIAEHVSTIWETAASFESLGCLPPGFLESVYGGVIRRHWAIVRPQVEVVRGRTGDPVQRHRFQAFAESGAAPSPTPLPPP